MRHETDATDVEQRDGQDAGGMTGACRVLVVDDSATQRLLLSARLRAWGYETEEAVDGADALAALARRDFHLVISDWNMPRLSGPELCRAIRQGETDSHPHVILVTARNEKSDVSAGLDAGADDFLSKPVDPDELAARLRAARRVVDLQRRLVSQREAMRDALGRLESLHRRMERDLSLAAELQRAFLPPPHAMVGGFAVAAACRPVGHVGGDHVGCFDAGDGMVGAYSIDVAGHGVASALIAIQLARLFDAADPARSIAFEAAGPATARLRPPVEVVADLDRRYLSAGGHDLYFTILYAILDRTSGLVRYCRAGHPDPAVLRADGSVVFHGEGGPPAGLLPGMSFREERIRLSPGDRLFLHSDGLTEADMPAGGQLGRSGLAGLLSALGDAPTGDLLALLIGEITSPGRGLQIDDDISALLIEMP